jgi:hypothetical protein
MSARTLTFTVTLLLAGCGPDQITPPEAASAEALRYAESFCNVRQSCGCDDGRFSSELECKQQLADAFDAIRRDRLAFDEDCFEATLASARFTGCPQWPSDASEYPACVVFASTKTEGQACKVYGELQPLAVSACDAGLRCDGGVCKSELSPSLGKVGDLCDIRAHGACEDALYCGSDGRCRAKKAAGEVCDQVDACSGLGVLYCKGISSGTGVCAARVGAGEACDPKDWAACSSPDFPDEILWCNSATNTCVPGEPSVCRLTHPLALPL